MEDSSSFLCPDVNCDMKFSSSSQLKTHRKKHEMILSLSKSSTPTISNIKDDTPTPVRFLRECEAVGLFKELHRNPFEETFRKAAENLSSNNTLQVTSASKEKSSDDSLHTPTVFPTRTADTTHESFYTSHLDDEERDPRELDTGSPVSPAPPPPPTAPLSPQLPPGVIKRDADSSGFLPISLPVATLQPPPPTRLGMSLESVQPATSIQPFSLVTVQPQPLSIPSIHQAVVPVSDPSPGQVEVCLKVSSGTTLHLAGNTLKILNSQQPSVTSAAIQVGTADEDVKLSEAELMRTMIVSPVGVTVHQPLQAIQPHPHPPSTNAVKQKLKSFLGKSVAVNRKSSEKDHSSNISHQFSSHRENGDKFNGMSPQRISSGNSSSSNVDEKRLQLREKNRVAAMRCRERRKAWVVELSKRADEMTATNRMLVQEVGSLRAEVATLKALLLAHKDCPVTLAAAAASAPVTLATTATPHSLAGGSVLVHSEPSHSPVSHSIATSVHQRGEVATVVDLRMDGCGNDGQPNIRGRNKKSSGGRSLSLDIESALSLSQHEATSPLVRRDEILSSVAPVTPSDDTMEVEECNGRSSGSLATPVIQLNPNVRPPFR